MVAATEDCYCCGQTVRSDTVARMLCHPEVVVCEGCANWLATWNRQVVRAVPVLRTENLVESTAFWEAAGFDVMRFGDDFAVAERDGVEMHLVGTQPDGRERGEAYLHARDVDDLHHTWGAAGLPVGAPQDQPWGMREFEVVDPGGNRLRVGRSL